MPMQMHNTISSIQAIFCHIITQIHTNISVKEWLVVTSSLLLRLSKSFLQKTSFLLRQLAKRFLQKTSFLLRQSAKRFLQIKRSFQSTHRFLLFHPLNLLPTFQLETEKSFGPSLLRFVASYFFFVLINNIRIICVKQVYTSTSYSTFTYTTYCTTSTAALKVCTPSGRRKRSVGGGRGLYYDEVEAEHEDGNIFLPFEKK